MAGGSDCNSGYLSSVEYLMAGGPAWIMSTPLLENRVNFALIYAPQSFTSTPTPVPTGRPTAAPTRLPSSHPTGAPTGRPTAAPSGSSHCAASL